MSRSSRHHPNVRQVVRVMNVGDGPFRVDATTTFGHWMHAWLDRNAAGIVDVMTVPDLPPGGNKVVVMAYRVPQDANELAELMAQSLGELVDAGVLPPGELAFAFQEPDPAPSSNTGRNDTDQQTQDGEGDLINFAIEALIKLRRDRASGV